MEKKLIPPIGHWFDYFVSLMDQNPETNLLMGMRSAGSSFGITTEFMYRFYPTPLPTYASTYVRLETAEDVDRLSNLSKSGDVKLQFAKAFHSGPVSTRLGLRQQVQDGRNIHINCTYFITYQLSQVQGKSNRIRLRI